MDHVAFPRFWKDQPALWFVQAEAVFSLSNITSDVLKYNYIISELDIEILVLIEDILVTPNNKYAESFIEFKTEIIRRLSISKLKEEKLGDQTPSEYYERLQDEAHSSVPEDTIKEIWLKGLPKHAYEVLSIAKGSMNSLSMMADKILEVFPLQQDYSEDTVISPNKNSPRNDQNENTAAILDKLVDQVKNLEAKVDKLQTAMSVCAVCKNRINVKDGIANKGQDKPEFSCWYHTNFGERAAKCATPCAYKDKQTTRQLSYYD